MTRLNPRVDFAFKKLFGSEENKAIVIAFINAVVERPAPITEIQFLNPYNHKDYPADKLSILDIKATDEQGRQYNIEMQITDQAYYNQRALYYWSKLYTSQLQQGDQFAELKQTISINVLNFNYFNDEPDYHNVFRLLHVNSHRCYFEEIELHFIELEKFDKEHSQLKTALDRWASFLKQAHRYSKNDIPAELQQDAAITQAIETLDTLYLSEEEREVYEARLKWLRDEAATLEKTWLKGLARGKQEGFVEGSEKSKRQIAAKLLQVGHSEQEVMSLTDLPLATIQALQVDLE